MEFWVNLARSVGNISIYTVITLTFNGGYMDNLFINQEGGNKPKKYNISKDKILEMITDNNVMSMESALQRNVVSIRNIFNYIDNVFIAFFHENNRFLKSLCVSDGADVKQELLKQYSFEIGALKKQLKELQPAKVLDAIIREFNKNNCDENIRLGISDVIAEIKKGVADIAFKPVESMPDLFYDTDPFIKNISDAKKNIRELKKCLAITGACRRKLITTVFRVLHSKYANNNKVIEIISNIEEMFKPKRRSNE